jgi:hypothetical protein
MGDDLSNWSFCPLFRRQQAASALEFFGASSTHE